MQLVDCAQSLVLKPLTVLCAVALVCPPGANAQQPIVVSGVVTDASHAPVFEAVVELAGTSLKARTDDRGEFRISGVAPGVIAINVRRLGFTPATLTKKIDPNERLGSVHILLEAVPTTVAPVVVEANRVEFKGRLAGYYERLRRRSNGQFVSREEIDRRSNRSLSQLLSASPGVSSARFRNGTSAVRMRGRSCRPLVWLDGVPMPAGEVDLDAISVSTLHGIELYLGTTAPFNYTASQGLSSCGTILLWSRGRDTEPAARPSPRPVDVEQLAATLSVLTAEQVDTPAQLRSPKVPEVIYPPSLFASGTEGTAVAEFVVRETGRIENGTFAIVSTSHPLFGEAVTRAMQNVTYSPAFKNGIPVSQVVQQRFDFSGPGKATKVSTLPSR